MVNGRKVNNSATISAQVVVKLAERSLPRPKDPGSNTAISNFYEASVLTVLKRQEEKEEAILKLYLFFFCSSHCSSDTTSECRVSNKRFGSLSSRRRRRLRFISIFQFSGK